MNLVGEEGPRGRSAGDKYLIHGIVKRTRCFERNWDSTLTGACKKRNDPRGVLPRHGSMDREEFDAHSMGYARVF